MCEVFLNTVTTVKRVKLATYKLLLQLTSYFDVLEVLRLEDEPNIAKDMLEAIVQDSLSPIDNDLVASAFQMMNTSLFGVMEKIEFLKVNEQQIL